MRSIRWKCFRKWHSKHYWHMVWLLLILIYTHTVHAHFNVNTQLSQCAIQWNSSRSKSLSVQSMHNYHFVLFPQHWFVAGHVTCFTGGHVALGVFVIIVLVLCALVIPISFILSVYQIEVKKWAYH